MASKAVLAGVYEPYREIPLAEAALLDALKTPDKLTELGQDMSLSVEEYVSFWKKANENTSLTRMLANVRATRPNFRIC